MATSPTYGKAQHYLAEQSTAIAIAPLEADGTAYEVLATYFVSPKISDISIKPGGTMKEFMGTDGQIEGFHVSGEYCDITFTIIPNGTTRANALLGAQVFRIGAPFTVSNAPVIAWLGHTEEAAAVTTTLTPTNLLNGTMFLQSMDERMSLEGETTGTITLRKYITAISPALIA